MQTMRRHAAPPAATSRTAKPAALLIAGSFLGLALAGCGGDDGPPTGPADELLLSYAPIAGVWVGDATTTQTDPPQQFSVRLSIGESAMKDDSVGTVHYQGSDPAFECSGTLFAEAVDGDVYEVIHALESGQGCAQRAQIHLTHDAAQARLSFESFIDGVLSSSGRLSRE